MDEVRDQERETSLLADMDELIHSESEIKLPGGKCGVPHAIVGLHIKVGLEPADLFRVGVLHQGRGKEQISRVYQNDVRSFTPEFLDEGRSPGQTAKLIRLSAAGLHLALEIGREDQGEGEGGLGRGRSAGCPQRESGKAVIIRNPRRRCFINPPSLEIPDKRRNIWVSELQLLCSPYDFRPVTARGYAS